MLVLESNQNHATAKDTEVCTTLPASMGLGGGYVPMIVDMLTFESECEGAQYVPCGKESTEMSQELSTPTTTLAAEAVET